MKTTLPKDSAARKEIPLYEGLFKYFPAALAAVAKVSKLGNDKHNPGQPLHHARGKSNDHESCIVRHLMDLAENGGLDEHGTPQVAYIAWRALALCQEWLEKHEGAPLAPGAKVDEGALPAGKVTELASGLKLVEYEPKATGFAGYMKKFGEGLKAQYAASITPEPSVAEDYSYKTRLIVKRGPNGEYGQDCRVGEADRRVYPYFRTKDGQRNGGRRVGDNKNPQFINPDGMRYVAELRKPSDRRVGEADRRKVNNEYIARERQWRRGSDYGRRSTDTAKFETLPKVGL